MQITNNALLSIFSSWTAIQEDQDNDIQLTEEFDQVDAHIINIAISELQEANNPDAHVKKEDQTDYVDVDRWVTVFVREVAVSAVELLSELSHCQSCCQSCC